VFKEQSNTDSARFIKKVEIKKSTVHGLGVFALEAIEKYEIFECAPVIIFHPSCFDNHKSWSKDVGYDDVITGGQHILEDYVFAWKGGMCALGLGWASIYNHSNDDANASYRMQASDTDDSRIEFYAKRDIQTGEEIFIHYNRGHVPIHFFGAE